MRRTSILAIVGLTAVACNEYEIKETTENQYDIGESDAPDIVVDPVSGTFEICELCILKMLGSSVDFRIAGPTFRAAHQ